MFNPKPWLAIPHNNLSKTATIIGGGISGASTAYSLALRNYQVTLIEQHSSLASQASGNHQAILYGSWSGHGGDMMKLSLLGYEYSYQLINKLLISNKDFANCGLVQLSHNEKQLHRNIQLSSCFSLDKKFIQPMNWSEIEKIAGIKVTKLSNLVSINFNLTNCIKPLQQTDNNQDGLFFPKGLWLKPTNFIYQLVNHPNITVKTNTNIQKIDYINSNWQIYTNDGSTHYANNIVLCNAHQAGLFEPVKHLPLKKIRGQTTLIHQQSNLKTILCGNGYITPAIDGKFTIGATFKFNDTCLDVRADEHLENIANFRDILPDIARKICRDTIEGWVNFRTTTPDYFPIVGPIAKYNEFISDYQKLALDKNYRIDTICKYWPGLYLNLAHGAKGMLTAPICGEIIANYLTNNMLLDEGVRQAIHPNRFYAKHLIHKNITKP